MSITTTRAAAVLRLFEDYYERVYCFARKSLPQEQAEDIAQEVFTRLLNLNNLENLDLSVSYLIKIADNLIKRGYGRNQRFKRYVESARQEMEWCGDEQAVAENSEMDLGDLADDFQSLATHEQDALRLIIIEGLSYEDAARSLGVPVSTINNWKYRAIQKLQSKREAAERGGVAA